MSAWPTLLLTVVSTIGLLSVFGLVLLDALLGNTNKPTIAERIQPWTNKNPWFAAALAFGLGALISHFFWSVWRVG